MARKSTKKKPKKVEKVKKIEVEEDVKLNDIEPNDPYKYNENDPYGLKK